MWLQKIGKLWYNRAVIKKYVAMQTSPQKAYGCFLVWCYLKGTSAWFAEGLFYALIKRKRRWYLKSIVLMNSPLII